MSRPTVKRPTQADIARLAGVSQATVSLVLNDRDAALRISPRTRARVLAAMRERGYVANASAQALAGGRNRLIGVHTFEPVFPTTGVDFYFPFLLGIEQEAAGLGHDLLLFTSVGGRRQVFRDGVNRLSLADGALLLGRHPDLAEIERLRDSGYPFVYVGHREVSGAPVSYVAADYAGATRRLTERLLRLGHARLAYARLGDGDAQPSRDREKGFRQALRAAHTRRLTGPVWTLESAGELDGLLDELVAGGVTGLLAEQQLLAERLRSAALRRGLSVPGDLSIAVLGDSTGASGEDVDWTGFVVPREAMGRTATRLLVRLLDDPDAPALVEGVACTVVPGATVGPR
ncbi:LacI family transcriptional regulator [Amycolatopsis deserti]|uniref:LacI family transcriptional regulator n=1 Tax=Amycolatopsis deserti TaxID=185696 RepID=A0ABQ3IER0_9PSEU|nr:LacI family DNA-binding transcriptional regulator [Amycolatopsis deserti]GHE79298.1 LacI family transcriptional regulator [Amycolatopsis deserti]